MEGNKQWKRVPFTIELAKDIQSGKTEGRIVTSENLLVRIVEFNFKDKTDSIVYIGTYANGEQEFIQTCDNEGKSFGADVLFIELPEETPKQKGELTLGKCKEGDEVWIYSNYEYGPEYVKVKVGKFSLDTSSGHRRNVTFDNGFTCQELTSQICWYENPDEQKTKTKKFKAGDCVNIIDGWHKGNYGIILSDKMIHYPVEDDYCYFVQIPSIGVKADTSVQFIEKHEFKPFDKVLVRDISGQWSAAYYSHYDKEEDKYSCGGVLFDECIPYDEHLVGTTDN